MFTALRILQLTNRIPYPLNDGGSIGIHYYLEGYLKAGCTLSMLAMNTTRHWVETDQLPEIYQRLQRFETVKVDNRIKPLAALKNLFGSTSYHIDRFISKAYETALIKLLSENDYDIIHLDGLYLTPYISVIREYSDASVVMRLHNPEFRIWKRLAAQEKAGLKKWYLNLLAKRLASFETAHINDYDLVLALSEEDAAFYKAYGCRVPIHIHPFGIDLSSTVFYPKSDSQNLKFYHLGAMDWLPNQESVDWLLQKVWPVVVARYPDAALFLAGRSMPQRYLERVQPGVEVVGEVPDAEAFEQDKDVLLVPLLSGGGVRIKIYRGMAAGKAVITTSVGVEGINAKDGEEVLIADTPEIFAEKIIDLLAAPEKAVALGNAAHNLIRQRYDAQRLMLALIERYNALIQKRRPQQRTG